VVVGASLWPFGGSEKEGRGGFAEWFRQRFERNAEAQGAVESLSARVAERFRELVWPASMRRWGYRFRAVMHVGAVCLALGSITGMYVRGWSKEYRAVWESTLLSETKAQTFFRVLFAPASAVTGQSIPWEQLPAMRRGADATRHTVPGDALPWIHLYAGTLALAVVVPRLFLLVLELARAAAVGRRALGSRDWQTYARRLLALVDGAGEPALILTHGLEHGVAAQDRWRQWAHTEWRDVGRIEFDSVPVGGEPEYVSGWVARAPRVMVVFNMAITPEVEVQRWLVEALAEKLRAAKLGVAPLLLAPEDTELRKRWSGFGDAEQRLGERAQAWRSTLQVDGAEWLGAVAS
ncbi:MAG: hypothetical protein ACOYMN_07585, partial [Roseimicrobium sp.]